MSEGKRGGRVLGARNKRTLAMLELADVGETPVAFGLRIMRDKEAPAELRLQGAKLAAPYIHPRPQPEPRLVEFELPESIDSAEGLMALHASLLRATAAGQLALEDARELSSILETQRRLVETVDMEARITRLEAERKP